MKKNKKQYHPPDLLFTKINFDNLVLSSVEELKSHIDDGGDWDDPIFDPDDNIDW